MTDTSASAAEVKASVATGSVCNNSGPYRSSRGSRVTVFVKKGDRFPADTDGQSTTWSMVSSSAQTL